MGRSGSTTSVRARQMRRMLARWQRSGLTLREFGQHSTEHADMVAASLPACQSVRVSARCDRARLDASGAAGPGADTPRVEAPGAQLPRASRSLNGASERATGVSCPYRCSPKTGRAYSFSSSALASFESAVPKPSVNQLLDLREHRARLVAAAGAVESRARLIVARSFAFRLHLWG